MQQLTERQKLAKDIETLEARYKEEMRGRFVPTPKSMRILNDIETLRMKAADLDRDAAQRLALDKAPIDEVLTVIAIPLLADVMNDIVADVEGMLRRNGCQRTIFGDYVRTIQHAAVTMVETLDHDDVHLPRLLDVDDTLVDAIRKKLMSFIKQRLKIKKK